MTDDTDAPTFRVEPVGDRLTLRPQFDLEDLSEREREQFDALRETFTSHYSGTVMLPDGFAREFEAGETVAVGAVGERLLASVRESMGEFRAAFLPFAKLLDDTADSLAPLVGLAEEIEDPDDE